MKMIIKIAKLELSTLFFSPIAWIVLFIFSLLCGISLVNFLDGKFMSLLFGEGYPGLTMSFLVRGDTAYYILIRTTLFVFIPLLTMGIISRERQSGSIKLLYSSPIKLKTIIAGKYIAILTFISVLMLIAFIGAFTVKSFIENADFNVALSGLLILFLLAAAYAAIGLYVSSLSQFPVVDVIVTVAILGFFDLMVSLVKEVPIARDIFYWFSLSQHTGTTLWGLITSGDIAYFVMIILLFLTLTWFKLESNRLSSRSKMISRLKVLGIIVCIAAIGYFLTHPKYTWYKDVTHNNSNTISPRLQNIIATLKDEPIKMTNYANIVGGRYSWLLPKQQIYDKQLYERYRRFLPDMELEYIMYVPAPGKFEDLNEYKQKSIKESLNKHKMELGKDVVTSGELMDRIDLESFAYYYSMRVLEYKDRRAIIPVMYSDPLGPAKEQEWMAAFLRLADSCHQVALLTGHKERGLVADSYQDKSSWNYFLAYRNLRESFINQGFEMRQIEPDKEIPSDIDLLIIADPKIEYTDEELSIIQNYIDKGGDLLIAGETENRAFINPVLSYLGVEILPGFMYNDNPAKNAPELITGFMTNKYGFFPEYSMKQWGGSIKIGFQGAGALKYNQVKGFRVSPLLTTDEKYTWLEDKKTINLEMIQYDPEQGEKKESFVVGIDMVRDINGKQQKIMVFSDADFMTQNVAFSALHNGSHSNFVLAEEVIQRWFTNSVLPPIVVREPGIDKDITIDLAGLSILKIIFWILLPLSIIVIGSIVLINRKRK